MMIPGDACDAIAGGNGGGGLMRESGTAEES